MDNIGFKGLFIKEKIALNFKAMWPIERPFFRQNHFNQSDNDRRKCLYLNYRSFAIISLAYIYFLALLVRLLFKVLSIFLFLVL